MQQFCSVLNCQDLQSTRDCIIYNHLNVSWKILDVNLKMCDEAHTFSKFFLGNMQAKQCGDSWFSTGWGPGSPKLSALTLSTGGGSALQKEGQATDSRCLAYKCMFVKQINISGFSFPLCSLPPVWSWTIFASLLKIFHLLEVLRGRMQSVMWSHCPRGYRAHPWEHGNQTLPRSLSDPKLFVCYFVAESFLFKVCF